MRILQITDSWSAIGGGSQTTIKLWLQGLTKVGQLVALVCNNHRLPLPLPNKQVFRMPSWNWSILPKYSFSPKLSASVEKQIINFAPQIFHFHEPQLTTWPLIKLAKRLGAKIVITFHTDFVGFAKHQSWWSPLKYLGFLVANQYQLMLGAADLVTVPSQFWQRHWQSEISSVVVVPHPVADEFFSRRSLKLVSNEPIKLLTVSRLSAEKKIDFLIKVMSELPPNFQLTIVGGGGDGKRLKRQVNEQNLSDRIKFLGWINKAELVGIYQSHHFFISPSKTETLGLTYLEALATGLPVIAADFAITQEVLPAPMRTLIKSDSALEWRDKIMAVAQPNTHNQFCLEIKNCYQELESYRLTNSTQKLIEAYQTLTPA